MNHQPDDLRALLAHHWNPEQIDYVLAYVTTTAPTPEGLRELEALRERRMPGGDAVITSRRPWNVIVKWRDLITVGLKTLGATAGGVAGGLGLLAGIGLALSTLPDLFELPTIALSAQHSEVVRFLWYDNDVYRVPIAAVQRQFSDWHEKAVSDIIADLQRLRIVAVEGTDLLKRDELVGAA